MRDDAPRLPAEWIALMRFLSSYYQRPLGETVIGALPPRLRSTKPLPRKVLAALTDSRLRRALRAEPRAHCRRSKQQSARRRVSGGFNAFLLHGVTGSGKTEVYLHLVAKALERGAQALVLVPEISLTPQLEARFREAFPEAQLALMHSGLEDVARTGAWLAAARGEAGIVLGTRLAVLAPLPKLGLIVVDEEHDASFKQQEGLRYSARDAAVYRAQARRLPRRARHRHAVARDLAQLALGRYERLELARARLARRAAAGGAHRGHARRSLPSKVSASELLVGNREAACDAASKA